MKYSVWYKKENSFFWNKLTKVTGDFVDSTSLPYPVRVFAFEDQSKIEIPLDKPMAFKFCKNRFLVIKKNVEMEARQNLNYA